MGFAFNEAKLCCSKAGAYTVGAIAISGWPSDEAAHAGSLEGDGRQPRQTW